MLKKSALALLALVALLAIVLAVNTVRRTSRQIAVAPVASLKVDAAAAAERLAGGVRIRTVSYDDRPDASAAEFPKLHAYLAAQYPKAHAALRREVVGGFSLLYTWPGSDAALKPILLMAHQDVVPVAPGTGKDWQADPFAGTIRDGFVWGRGAWDDKGNLFAIMEAVEALAAQGFAPRRSVLLAFGHDEEAGGERGAVAIAALLKSRGVRPEFVLDEGLLLTEGILKGLDKPLALIGVAEKGILNLRLTATATPGHSSMPPPHTAIGRLGAAVARLEADPMPASLGGVAGATLAAVAPEMPGLNRVVLSNLWLFGPLVKSQFEKGVSTNALLRTTTAPTLLSAGSKINVLPGEATAAVNFRLLPGDTLTAVTDHARRAVADDAVRIDPMPGVSQAEASPVSPTDAAPYRLIERTVRELFPNTLVAPGLMLGATDARHMAGIADNIYRFSPVRAKSEDLARFHGTNERISIANFVELIGFYHWLIAAGAGVETTR